MRARRIDANQPEIVFALRAVGCRVLHLHTLGQGVPDLCVATPGPCSRTLLMEIKQPGEDLNDLQRTWHADWPGQIVTVTSVTQALNAVGVRG